MLEVGYEEAVGVARVARESDTRSADIVDAVLVDAVDSQLDRAGAIHGH